MAEQGTEPTASGRFSRRGMLIGGAAVVVGAGGAGALWLGFSNPRDLVVALMRHALPGVDLDPDSTKQCAQEIVDERSARLQGAMTKLTSALKLKGVTAASHILGAGGVAGLGPFEEQLEEITRAAVTRLLPNSNFFHVADPMAERIYYQSPDPDGACINPFANLSPPAA